MTISIQGSSATKTGHTIHVLDDNNQENYLRRWDWDDGTTTERGLVDSRMTFFSLETHTYTSPGTYDISLIRVSNGNVEGTAQVTISADGVVSTSMSRDANIPTPGLSTSTFDFDTTLTNATGAEILYGDEDRSGLSTQSSLEYESVTGLAGKNWPYNTRSLASQRFKMGTLDLSGLAVTEVFAYGYDREIAASLSGQMWTGYQNTGVEQSWMTCSTNGTQALVMGLKDGTAITDVQIYPKNVAKVTTLATLAATLGLSEAALVAAVSGLETGMVIIDVPYNTRIRVTVNGDETQGMTIANSPVASPAPLSHPRVDWSTMVHSTTAADATTYTAFVLNISEIGTTYSVGDQFRVLLNYDEPDSVAPSSGKHRNYEICTAEVVTDSGAKVVKLIDHDGTELRWATPSAMTNPTIALVDHLDTSKFLYFPAGVHTIGRMFRITSDVQVYLDKGAVVVGTFDMRRRYTSSTAPTAAQVGDLHASEGGADNGMGKGIRFRGPGLMAGVYLGREEIQSDSDPDIADGFATLDDGQTSLTTAGYYAWTVHSLLFNEAGGTIYMDNSISEITMVAPVFHLEQKAASRWTNVQVICPWYWNADGPQIYKSENVQTGEGSYGRAKDCLFFCGDDCIKTVNYSSNIDVSGCMLISIGNSPINGGYWPREPQNHTDKQIVIRDCDIVAFGHGDIDQFQAPQGQSGLTGEAKGARCLFRIHSDGYDGAQIITAGGVDWVKLLTKGDATSSYTITTASLGNGFFALVVLSSEGAVLEQYLSIAEPASVASNPTLTPTVVLAGSSYIKVDSEDTSVVTGTVPGDIVTPDLFTIDGGQRSYGMWNYTVDDIRVWGASTQRPFCIGNIRYPFAGTANMANQRDQHGNIDNVTLSNWYFEQEFTQKGVLIAHDDDNKPTNVTVDNWYVDGTLVTNANKADYFDVDSEVTDFSVTSTAGGGLLDDPSYTYPTAGTFTAVVRASNRSTSAMSAGIEATTSQTAPQATDAPQTSVASAQADTRMGSIQAGDPWVSAQTSQQPHDRMPGVGPTEKPSADL